jgi:uncharacterized protein (DUF58 family)
MSTDLIPPAVRHRLRPLRLTSQRAIGAHGLGLHPSHSRGAGIEFAQYRAYEPGDELRQIDWKLYGRSDKFFVRESERESPLALWILIDASASMAQEDSHRPGWTRLDAAKSLAACLVELALVGGDRFGWVVLSDAGLHLVAPASGSRQRDRLRLELAGLKPGHHFPPVEQLAPIWERIGARDLVIMLSDCFDDKVVHLMGRLSAAGREALVIQLLTVDERDFPFDGGYRFRDQESGQELLGDGTALRDDYLARFAAARAQLQAELDAHGIRNTSYVLDEELDAPLRRLFGRGEAG